MEIPTLIEPVAGNGYAAKTGEPLPLRAEGPTPGAALHNLKELIARRLGDGSQIVPVSVADVKNPWEAMAGIFDPNDPDVQEWIEIMAENRRKADEELDLP
jgi:hypothetical protein